VHRSRFSKALISSLLFLTLGVLAHSQSSAQQIVIDTNATATPFPHFWEQMFGSGRAVLALRDNYRKDLREVREATDFRYVRFHGIFHDEVGVYSEDANGQPVYNFSYVDQIYDGLLADGAKPFVELSFMPNALAARNMPHAFWYKPNISPPKDWGKWDALITQFAKHVIERYGIDEVSKWYFEVWNEPNLDFWGGDPKQSTYWELYDHTAKALKAVDTHLRVGGPSTAQAGWADAFIAHCSKNQVPVDFVSSHVYGNDKAEDVFGTHEEISRNQMVCRAVRKVHDQIKASPMPQLPLIWTEFNASYMNEPDVTDSTYMGPWMADTIRQCDGLVDMMSYWTFSDVFEEQGVVKTPFYGGFGLIAVDDIPKPAFAAFKLLHELGEQRIAVESDSALLTRRKDGTLVLAVWNYAPPNSKEGSAGNSKTVTLEFKGGKAKQAMISRVDGDHGDVRPLYAKMGSPRYPTPKQIEELRRAAALPSPEKRALKNGALTITLPPQGLAVIELK
jgi:xylan 1,4-beta-xylosidase